MESVTNVTLAASVQIYMKLSNAKETLAIYIVIKMPFNSLYCAANFCWPGKVTGDPWCVRLGCWCLQNTKYLPWTAQSCSPFITSYKASDAWFGDIKEPLSILWESFGRGQMSASVFLEHVSHLKLELSVTVLLMDSFHLSCVNPLQY